MEAIIKFRDDFKSLLTKLSAYDKLKNDVWWKYFESFDQLIDILIDIYNTEELSQDDKCKVLNTFRYLVSPLDSLPELVFGLNGFKDDLYLVAYILNYLINEQKYNNINLLIENKNDLSKKISEIVIMGDNYFTPEIKESIIETLNSQDESILESIELTEDSHKKEATKNKIEESYNQEDAFMHKNGPMMVIAGPGAGKTYTIENRVYNLIIKHKIDPGNILVTTFTNKAADELMLRLKERLKKEDNLNEIISNICISTIHAFCYRLIKDFHHKILFLKGTYIPIEENNQLLFLYQNSEKIGLETLYEPWKKNRKKAGDPDYRINKAGFYTYISNIYNFVSEELLNAKQETICKYYDVIYQPESLKDIDLKIISTYPEYWKLITRNGKLDQSMVLSYVEALLDDKKILQSIRQQYKYLLIDEYQDTNPIQARIFNKISGSNGNLFAVGDDDQSIYKFRGADVTNITDFSRYYPDARFVYIGQNKRSTKPLVEASKALISNNEKRIEKPLNSEKESSVRPIVITCESDDCQIAETIKYIQYLKEKQFITSYSQIGILFRSIRRNGTGQKLYSELQKNNIPALMSSDKSLFKQPEISNFLNVLDALVTDRSLDVYNKHHAFFKMVKWEKKKANEYLKAIKKNIKEEETGILSIFYKVLSDTLYFETANDFQRSNIGIFSHLISDFEEVYQASNLNDRIKSFLKFCRMINKNIDQAGIENIEGVNLLNIHQAKGLEFDYVFIINVIDDYYPPSAIEKLRTYFLNNKDDNYIEEERRVLYVGLTRAANGLFLLTSKGNESPFLSEIKDRVDIIDTFKEIIPEKENNINSSKEQFLKISHSDIFDYNQCPYKYKLKSIHRINNPLTLKPVLSGLFLHRSVEVIHRLVKEKQKIDEHLIDLIFDKSWISSAIKYVNSKDEELKIKNIFKNYAQSFIKPNGNHNIVDIEKIINLTINNNILLGRIDLIRESIDGQLEIVEFKYSKDSMQKSYIENQLNHYNLLYAKEEPKLIAYFLKENEELLINAENKSIVENTLINTANNIIKNNFDPSNNYYICKECSLNTICPEETKLPEVSKECTDIDEALLISSDPEYPDICKAIYFYCKEQKIPIPEFGYEFENEAGNISGQIEIAWVEEKVGLYFSYQEEDMKPLKEDKWNLIKIEDFADDIYSLFSNLVKV